MIVQKSSLPSSQFDIPTSASRKYALEKSGTSQSAKAAQAWGLRRVMEFKKHQLRLQLFHSCHHPSSVSPRPTGKGGAAHHGKYHYAKPIKHSRGLSCFANLGCI
eukprot:6081942-Amphidinium_carterae.1